MTITRDLPVPSSTFVLEPPLESPSANRGYATTFEERAPVELLTHDLANQMRYMRRRHQLL